MTMRFDAIIATYNRPDKIIGLVNELLSCKPALCQVIVVDSSEKANEQLLDQDRVLYIKSNHKNQPYQRYIGCLISESDILIFLDDDMEIVDLDFIKKIEKIFEDASISGIALKFENKHEDSLLAQIPESMIFKHIDILKKLKGWLTGYVSLPDGKYGLCGNRGKQPSGGGITEWLSGGAFSARRSAMFQNFNFQLFDIFEKRMGMGEDGIIGYGISKHGKLVFHDELFFLHNDQKDSTYTSDVISFSMKVAFSRLYLSLEKTRIDKGSFLQAYIHYHWYMLWRITGLLGNFLINRSTIRKRMLIGSWKGWKLAVTFNISGLKASRSYWHEELKQNLNKW